MNKSRAPRNKTLSLSSSEKQTYKQRLLTLSQPCQVAQITDRTILADLLTILPYLPQQCIDLLIIDPPYNLTKSFNSRTFSRMSLADYETWLDSWLSSLIGVLKPHGSLYICGDWQSSTAIHRVMARYCTVRNRITWEREKGRGAKRNWKNSSEDIWFGTLSDNYTFNVEAVKLKRKVIAPYTDEKGNPKDWAEEEKGRFRLTSPSNLWTDLTVPFWSMPENTDHPTQKPEKLLAKLILASSNLGDIILDPFLGSGTTSVVAKKLNRQYIGIEIDQTYACLAEKRLALVTDDENNRIQGYAEGVFWERNSHNLQNQASRPSQNKRNEG
ncbi:MAG: DNA methyltransferase [Chloroflexota bacterium]